MLAGSEPQQPKPPKAVRRRRHGLQPGPELDARAAEMRLRQSSTKEETERAEKHLQLLRSMELVGPPKSVWLAVTTYLVLIIGCATSRVASAVGVDSIVSTTLAKVRCTTIEMQSLQVGSRNNLRGSIVAHDRNLDRKRLWLRCSIMWSAQPIPSSSRRK